MLRGADDVMPDDYEEMRRVARERPLCRNCDLPMLLIAAVPGRQTWECERCGLILARPPAPE